MPTNLNALIRYKQIDACLKNPFANCTISHLQELCTQSMGEKRGIYKLVSERTIRDDIRVLKSDILGFNAPIVFEDGRYFYSDPDFSIFSIPLTEKDLLKEVLSMLLEERKNKVDEELDKMMVRIANTIGEAVPEELMIKPKKQKVIRKAKPAKPIEKSIVEELSNEVTNYSIKPTISDKRLAEKLKEINSGNFRYAMPSPARQSSKAELVWGDVLSLLS